MGRLPETVMTIGELSSINRPAAGGNVPAHKIGWHWRFHRMVIACQRLCGNKGKK